MAKGSMAVINCLCTAFAILIMHICEFWPNIVKDLTKELNGNVDEATGLLMILTYLASDCDNESIVIEDSKRSQFFMFLD